MKTKLPPNAAEIAQAAPIATSGALGAEFWEEVEQRLERDAPAPVITPRPILKPR